MITSFSNTKVKHVRRLQAERRYRWRESQFVVEGTRWLTELVGPTTPAQLVLATEAWAAEPDNAAVLNEIQAPVQLISAEIMTALSDTETPPGVLAVVDMVPRPISAEASFLLILDQLTNPGNLGTILRTASAAGVEGVLLSPGCVDPYNPKVVRGSMGALLRLPVVLASWEEIGSAVAHCTVWVATIDGQTLYSAVDWRQPSAIIIGSEAHGASQQARQLATGTLTIPMQSQLESLNAAMATGIILFEAARQRGEWPSP